MKMRILCIGLLASSVSCQSISHVEREPSQVAPVSAKETSANGEIQTTVEKLLAGDSESRLKLESQIRSHIQVAAWAQQLATSYDLLIDLKLAQVAKGRDSGPELTTTELACKLWEAAYFYERTEEQLAEIQQRLLEAGRGDLHAWFLGYFKSNKGDSPAHILTKAQLVRFLKSDYASSCEGRTCPGFPPFPGKPQSAFNPFNDAEMLAFKKKFSKRIATYSPEALVAMPKGQCQDGDGSRAPNAATYEWKTRNRLGKKLQAGEFVFTYDDGPHPKHTIALVDAWLKSGLGKPAFFWLAANVQKYPDVARDVHAQGLEVAVHSFSHPDIGNLAAATDLSKLSKVNRSHFASELKAVTASNFAEWQAKALDRQTLGAMDVIRKTLGSGAKVNKFRLPYGSGVRNPAIGERFAALDVDHFFWDIDSLDWQDKNALSVVERVRKGMELSKRGIILFHDIHPQSVEASRMLIREFQDNKHGKVLSLEDARY